MATQRLNALQYLRAIAALAVVYSHSVMQVDAYQTQLPEWGSFGVDIFFVISGFIMVFIAKPTDTPIAFFKNRIRRVVPLYWFFTAVMALILIALPSLFKSSVFSWQALVTSLFFIPDYSITNPEFVWPILAPGWSLNYEMYFYFVFAMSLLLPLSYRLCFISAVIIGVYALAQYIDSSSAINAFYSDSIVFEFILGMILAALWKQGRTMPQWAAIACIVVGFGLISLKLPLLRIFEYGIPSLLVVTGCVYLKTGANKFMLLLGDSSYALYLSHIFSLGIMRKILPPMLGESGYAPILFVLISTVFCVIVGVVVHVVIDNWLLRKERLAIFKRSAA